jgi:heme exporter protein CcmD
MIEGGWNYVWPAYAIALGALAVLAVVVLQRLRTWARRARELDELK